MLMLLGFGIITQNAKAQSGRFSVGLEVAQPMGTMGDAAGFGIGGSLRYELPVGDNLGIMLTAGYLSFGGKDIDFVVPGLIDTTIEGPSTSVIPIQLGAKYYFNEAQDGFYAQLEVGVHMFSYGKIEGDTTDSESKTYLSFAPGVGYHLANLDFGLKYQLINGIEGFDETTFEETTEMYSYLGLRIAYVFGEK